MSKQHDCRHFGYMITYSTAGVLDSHSKHNFIPLPWREAFLNEKTVEEESSTAHVWQCGKVHLYEMVRLTTQAKLLTVSLFIFMKTVKMSRKWQILIDDVDYRWVSRRFKNIGIKTHSANLSYHVGSFCWSFGKTNSKQGLITRVLSPWRMCIFVCDFLV